MGKKHRSLLGRALGLGPGDKVTVRHTGDSVDSWEVRRGRGRADPKVEEAVVNSLAYEPESGKWIPRGKIVETGATIVVKQ